MMLSVLLSLYNLKRYEPFHSVEKKSFISHNILNWPSKKDEKNSHVAEQ